MHRTFSWVLLDTGILRKKPCLLGSLMSQVGKIMDGQHATDTYRMQTRDGSQFLRGNTSLARPHNLKILTYNVTSPIRRIHNPRREGKKSPTSNNSWSTRRRQFRKFRESTWSSGLTSKEAGKQFSQLTAAFVEPGYKSTSN